MFNRFVLKAALASTVAAAATFAAMPAHAQLLQTRSVSVFTGDIDLSSAAGKSLLHSRIGGAVRQVCGTADVRDLPASSDLRACRKGAWESAQRGMVQVFAAKQDRIQIAAR